MHRLFLWSSNVQDFYFNVMKVTGGERFFLLIVYCWVSRIKCEKIHFGTENMKAISKSHNFLLYFYALFPSPLHYHISVFGLNQCKIYEYIYRMDYNTHAFVVARASANHCTMSCSSPKYTPFALCYVLWWFDSGRSYSYPRVTSLALEQWWITYTIKQGTTTPYFMGCTAVGAPVFTLNTDWTTLLHNAEQRFIIVC